MMKYLLVILFALSLFSQGISQTLEVTVSDVGAGLCIIGSIPNEDNISDPFYVVYDAGFSCIDIVQSIIPASDEIDLMVLSHNDSDHIANADEILGAYQVRKIIWSGFERPDVVTWNEVNQAIDNETGAEIINLKTDTLAIGSAEIFGQTYITFVAGFHVPPEEWGFSPSDRSEYRNAGSIVMRIVYNGKSILLTGDMVGRHEERDHPEYHIIAAEKYVTENRHAVPIDSDVLVASHHGGNDASSYPFIHAVSPEYVIFSAGSHDNFGHPRESVAQRFLNSGVQLDHIFRTDLGDDETKPEHWENETTILGQSDSVGDDHVMISIDQEGKLNVEYVNSQN